MIRPLRQRHYQTFVAIGFLLPVVFAFGLVARKPFPTMDSLPAELTATTPKFLVPEWERTDLFAKSPIKVRLLRENRNPGSLAVAFSTAKDYFIKPDLMVYWVAGQSSRSATSCRIRRNCWANLIPAICRCQRKPPPRTACWCFTASRTTKSWMFPSRSSSISQPGDRLTNP